MVWTISCALVLFLLIVVKPLGTVTHLTVHLVSVETLVIQHFASEGWRGVHCENGLWMMLTSLLFADIIFDSSVCDSFHAPLRSAPLDWHTDSFYARRRAVIDARFVEFGDASNGGARIAALLQSAFARFEGCSLPNVDWDAFALEHLQTIAASVGTSGLAAILRRLIVDGAAWAGGLPDLLLIRAQEAMLVGSFSSISMSLECGS